MGGEDIVVGAEAGHDAVDWSEAGMARGDVAADLGEDDRDAGLRRVSLVLYCLGRMEYSPFSG